MIVWSTMLSGGCVWDRACVWWGLHSCWAQRTKRLLLACVRVCLCACVCERAQSQQKHLCLPAATEANTVFAAHTLNVGGVCVCVSPLFTCTARNPSSSGRILYVWTCFWNLQRQIETEVWREREERKTPKKWEKKKGRTFTTIVWFNEKVWHIHSCTWPQWTGCVCVCMYERERGGGLDTVRHNLLLSVTVVSGLYPYSSMIQ